MTTIQAHSIADADSLAVKMADKAVNIGPPHAAKSYLNISAILAAAEATGAEAIHPGYGFLSENAAFADAVEAAGLVFVGPKGKTIRTMGDKAAARAAALRSGRAGRAGLGRTHRRPRDGARGRRRDRLSRDDQGVSRRRRTRHSRRRERRGLRVRLRSGERRSESRVRRRRPLSGEIHRPRPPYRGAGARRRARRDPLFRARMLIAAPAPEGLGRGAVARPLAAGARGPLRLRRRAGPGGELSRRRHARISLRRGDGPLLFHRDEHPHPGRASRDRDGDGDRSRARDVAHRRRGAAGLPPIRRALDGPRHRGAHQRRGPRRQIPPLARRGDRLSRARRTGDALRHPALSGLSDLALLRFAARQADRLG